jgi:predicted unusual protein kinase regulating ubiquinone biosynthesis (AarF/ABC1/UbiB family)
MDHVTTADARAPAGAARRVRWRITVRSAQMLRAGVAAARVFAREGCAAPTGTGRSGHARGRPGAGRALHRAGRTFIEVGQIASTRAALLPRPLIDELALLRDRVPPFPFVAVRATVEADLGRPLDAVYAAFDPVPVAAASVAQVHRAVMHGTGEVVAVKVRRPAILDTVKLDRSILLFVGRTLERLVPSFRLMFVDNIRARGLANLQVTLEIGRIFDILRRHRIQARSHMTMVNLAPMTAGGLGKRLAPELSLTDAALPYLSEVLAAAPDSPQPAG